VAQGGYIAEGAPQPSNRTAALVKQGVSKADASQLQWSKDGLMVNVGGEAMRWDDPSLPAALAAQRKGEVRAAEEHARVYAPLTEPPLPWWEQPVPYSGAPKNEYGEATGSPGIQYAPYYLGGQRIR
jgi:hypothetical protein